LNGNFKAPTINLNFENPTRLPSPTPKMHPLGNYAAYAFGGLCILSALPLCGIPFPNSEASAYYLSKSQWMSELTGHRLSRTQTGYLAAVMRIALGVGFISFKYRKPACAVMAAIVGPGTVFAIRDGKPLLPQFGMLGAVAAVWILG
jgi:hypothetical protein